MGHHHLRALQVILSKARPAAQSPAPLLIDCRISVVYMHVHRSQSPSTVLIFPKRHNDLIHISHDVGSGPSAPPFPGQGGPPPGQYGAPPQVLTAPWNY